MVRMLSLVIILVVPSAFVALDPPASRVPRVIAHRVLGAAVTAPADVLRQAHAATDDGAPRAGP